MYLAKSSGLLPGKGLINGAFVIKIVRADDEMQQKNTTGRNNPSDDYLDNVIIGDKIQARVDGKNISGSVTRIIKNELGDCIYVEFTDDKGELHKADASSVHPDEKIPDVNKDYQEVSSPGFNESKFLSFEQFL